MNNEYRVELDEKTREVVIHLQSTQVRVTYTVFRHLICNGLLDAASSVTKLDIHI